MLVDALSVASELKLRFRRPLPTYKILPPPEVSDDDDEKVNVGLLLINELSTWKTCEAAVMRPETLNATDVVAKFDDATRTALPVHTNVILVPTLIERELEGSLEM
jgi:hypothetical protein